MAAIPKGNLLVAQSGGSTAVINASLAGVVAEAQKHRDQIETIYGGVEGIEGILKEKFLDLTTMSSEDITKLRVTPGAALYSCRLKMKEEHLEAVYEVFKAYNIRYFFYIGGNDSQDSTDKVSAYMLKKGYAMAAIGVPKTIDNDLVVIDHCPGFGSCAKYLATSLRELALDAQAFSRNNVITLVEVMGRNAGWIAASSILAKSCFAADVGPHMILLPEVAFKQDKFLERVRELLKSERHVVIVVSEGIKDEKGQYLSVLSDRVDSFGHPQIGNVVEPLKQIIENNINGVKIRDHRCSYLQRAAGHVASKSDNDEAFQCGVEGVKAAIRGETAKMVTMIRAPGAEYKIDYVLTPVAQIANGVKDVPHNFITDDHFNVNEKLVTEYMLPLIQGEVCVPYKNGAPDYFKFDMSKTVEKKMKREATKSE